MFLQLEISMVDSCEQPIVKFNNVVSETRWHSVRSMFCNVGKRIPSKEESEICHLAILLITMLSTKRNFLSMSHRIEEWLCRKLLIEVDFTVLSLSSHNVLSFLFDIAVSSASSDETSSQIERKEVRKSSPSRNRSEIEGEVEEEEEEEGERAALFADITGKYGHHTA